MLSAGDKVTAGLVLNTFVFHSYGGKKTQIQFNRPVMLEDTLMAG